MDKIIGFIQLGVYIGSLVSFYWMLKSDVRLLKQRMDEIEEDRRVKWTDYKITKSRSCDKLNEVIVGVREIKTNLKWIMKNLDK